MSCLSCRLDIRLSIKVRRHLFEHRPHGLIPGGFRQSATLAGTITQFVWIGDHSEETKPPLVLRLPVSTVHS